MDECLLEAVQAASDADAVRQVVDLLKSPAMSESGLLTCRRWEWLKSPLHSAARIGRADVVRILAHAGFDVNAIEEHVDECAATTPLHEAVNSNKPEVVRVLLQLGANANARCDFAHMNGTALDMAKKFKYRQIEKILEDYHNAFGNARIMETSTKSEDDAAKEIVQALGTKAKIDELTAQLDSIVLKAQAAELVSEINKLKRSSHFRDSEQLRALEARLAGRSAEEQPDGGDEVSCPVCLATPEANIYSCGECESILCSSCRFKIKTCPICRLDFESAPPKRNRWAERLVATMNKVNK